jgi:hypothetical protein
MIAYDPFDTLRDYRLGSRQAQIELAEPVIRIEFDVLRLVEDVQSRPGQAVILTGTAGDGKTYLAFLILDALGISRRAVRDAQVAGGYDREGVFVDLDLSAGPLSGERVQRLHHVLSQPQRLTLICANEGKLSEFEDRLHGIGLHWPENVLCINLSHRALVSPAAWDKVLAGVLSGPLWEGEVDTASPLAWNRAWLQDAGVAARLRCYLLLPYLLGEPITVREILSFLAYALGGGLGSAEATRLEPAERIRYLLFNTLFSEPEGYLHGGRATPTEKLLWWLFRFDPADQASPEVDLRLLVGLDKLKVSPPPELLSMWHNDLVVREGEERDKEYRARLGRFMAYGRRWYTLASDTGLAAYFPFHHFASYLQALNAPGALEDLIPTLIRGLNLLLSGGQVDQEYKLNVFYLVPEGNRQGIAIYSTNSFVFAEDFALETDLAAEVPETAVESRYLERLPRRLYLKYRPQPQVRLPVSLLLYEVLSSVAGPTGGFPATMWSKERDAVTRFVAGLNREVRVRGPVAEYTVHLDTGTQFDLTYRPANKRIDVS